jgi:hypothetical protein
LLLSVILEFKFVAGATTAAATATMVQMFCVKKTHSSVHLFGAIHTDMYAIFRGNACPIGMSTADNTVVSGKVLFLHKYSPFILLCVVGVKSPGQTLMLS